jgi:hypothetical protein
MKRVGLVSTAVLSLSLASPALTYAQQEQQTDKQKQEQQDKKQGNPDKQAPPAKQAEPATQAKPVAPLGAPQAKPDQNWLSSSSVRRRSTANIWISSSA